MGRKIMGLFLCVVLFGAVCTTAHAETYTAYDGSFSTTYVQYFRDILSHIGLKDHYVAFRSGQNEYKLIVGDIAYNGGFTSSNPCKVYSFSSASGTGYSSYYTYDVSEINNMSLTVGNKIIYSDLGDYPELIDRGAKFETLNTMLLCVLLLGTVLSRFFRLR